MTAAHDDVLFGEVVDSFPFVPDLTAVGFLEKADKAHERALAGSGQSDYAENLVGGYGEADAFHGMDRIVCSYQILQFYLHENDDINFQV